MRFSMLACTYNIFGSHPTLRELTDRIARVFGEVEFGLEDVEIVVWRDTAEPTKPTLEASRSRFRKDITRLPKARFESRLRRLRISYANDLNIGWERGEKPQINDRVLTEVLNELLSVLEGFRAKLNKKPGLEAAAFINALAARRSMIIPSGEAAENSRFHVDPAQHWSIRFKIDWSQYHPRARDLLDDPFYWDPADDASPHGANSGSHLLGEFRRWRQRHPKGRAWDYFLDRFRRPGDLGRLNQFRQTRLDDYVERDGLIAQMHDRDIVALAFALLKIDGDCDPEIGAEALKALARKQDATTAARLGWTSTAKDIELALMLERKLRCFVR